MPPVKPVKPLHDDDRQILLNFTAQKGFLSNRSQSVAAKLRLPADCLSSPGKVSGGPGPARPAPMGRPPRAPLA
jgi:hypothetical protein